MSHVRNLFHKPFGERIEPAPPAAAGGFGESRGSSSAVASAVSARPEFPTEQADIRPESRLVFYADPRSPAADRIRFLRMRLREHWTSGKLKTLLVTSPLAHDGKSTLVLNLATALSERGKRTVLVVESDLHRSSLTDILKLKPWPGLSDALADDSISPLSTIRRVDPLGLHLLPGGEPPRNPTELLQTPALGNVLQKISPYFDWILFDSPPATLLTDAISLQQHADATLLVVRAGITSREATEQAMKLLGPKKIFAAVLNGVDARDHLYYHYRNHDNTRPAED